MQLRPQMGEGDMPEQEEMAGSDVYDTGEIDPGIMEQGEEAAAGAPPPVMPVDPGTMGVPPAPPGQEPVPPAGAGFNPDDSTFDERQKNMTPQERADWATKKYGSMAPAGEEAPPKKDPAADRERFEKHVFDTIGGDPFARDVMKEVDEHTIKDLPKVFNKVFGGKVIWEDRHRLDKKQAAHWDAEVKAFRAYVKEMVDSDKKTKIESYKQIMGRFDIQQKTEEAEQRQAEARAAKLSGAADKQKTAQASQQRAIKTESTRLQTLTNKLQADIVANAKALAAAGPKEKEALLLQQQSLMQELSGATAERHQFKMQHDKPYAQAWKEKEAETAEQQKETVKSHAAGEREASGRVSEDKANKPAQKPSSAPAGGKKVESERASKDGSGNKLRTYSDGTTVLVRPDGTETPVKVKASK